jgi:beta-phosphoglucomutase
VRHLQAVVFDFDGVLVNSEPVHLRAYQEVLEEEGVSLSARDYYSKYVGLDDVAVFAALQRDRGLDRPPGWASGLIARKTTRVQELLTRGSALFPGAAACVSALAGEVPLAVASGALRHEIEGVLAREGLAGCFSLIVAAGETARGKPYPDPYATAVARLAEQAGTGFQRRRCVAIEDTRQGLASAAAAGLRTVALTTTYPAEALAADLVLPGIAEVSLARLEALTAPADRSSSDASP